MKKTGATIIYILFVILLLGGAIAGLLYLTNGGTTAPRLFDVKYNDTNIDGQIVTLSNFNKPVEFVITSKIGEKLPSNIQVRALPNENAKKISYSIGALDYTLDSCNDLSDMFNIVIEDNKVTVSSEWKLAEFLANYYAEPIESIVFNEYLQGSFSFVDLCFISGDLTVKCSLLEYVNVAGVEFDNDTIFIGGYND